MSKRVVITGLGIVSCIGNSKQEASNSLEVGKSGIVFKENYAHRGLRCHIAGEIDIELEKHLDRKHLRFMSRAAAYSYIAAEQAIVDAGLPEDVLKSQSTGLIVGSGCGSMIDAFDVKQVIDTTGNPKKIGPYRVTKNMSSTTSACLSTFLGIQGVSYTISSACTTSLHCVSNAADYIRLGRQEVMIAGGGEEESFEISCLFDAMGALSSRSNDAPSQASCPFDKKRDGFVPAGGAGIVVLESLEHALARKAPIYGEVIGYFANSDGVDMVSPSGDGAKRCMLGALQEAGNPTIDYINTHGTSTPVGDIAEIGAIKEVFANSQMPLISSTKSLTGHSLGATGSQELIYSLLMMQGGFVAPTLNYQDPIDEAQNLPISPQLQKADIKSFMTNSFGFGGTNGSMIVRNYVE